MRLDGHAPKPFAVVVVVAAADGVAVADDSPRCSCWQYEDWEQLNENENSVEKSSPVAVDAAVVDVVGVGSHRQ